MTRSSELMPAAWWRPSMFWVMTWVRRPPRSRSTEGEVAGVGLRGERVRGSGCGGSPNTGGGYRDCSRKSPMVGAGIALPDAARTAVVRDTRFGADAGTGKGADDARGSRDVRSVPRPLDHDPRMASCPVVWSTPASLLRDGPVMPGGHRSVLCPYSHDGTMMISGANQNPRPIDTTWR